MRAAPLSRHIVLISLSAICVLSPGNAHGASGTWTLNATGGTWDNSANWQSGIIADGATLTANFSTLNLTSDIALTLGVDRTIGNLTFGDTTPSNHSWTISGNALNMNGYSQITVNNLGTGQVTIGSAIAIAGSPLYLDKAGSGTLVLTGANTFTTQLRILGGKVIAGGGSVGSANALSFTTGTFVASSAFAINTNLIVSGGSTGTFDTNGFNVTTGHLNNSGAGTFNKTGAGILTLGGSYTSGGTMPSAINVLEGTLRSGGDHRFRWATYTISSGATLDFMGYNYNADNRGLYGAGVVTASSSTRDIRFSYGDFSGNIQQGRLLKENATALTLSGTNDFAGTTTVSAGTLIVTGSLANSTSYSIASGAKLQIGNATTTGSITTGAVANAGTLEFARSNALTFANAITGAGTVIQSGAGVTTLGSKAYTGVTQITGGTLSASVLANGGTASSVGASANAASNLILNGGTLQYTGAAQSTDRLFSVGTSGGTLDASGSGTVNFTNAGSMGFNAQTGTRTLTLTGSNAGDNILAAVIGDNTGATGLVKNGAGKWVLSGVSAYTGGTTVNLGTLALSGANRLASTGTVLVAGGALDLGAVAQSVGAVTLSSGTISNGTLTGTSYSATNSGTVSAVLAGSGAFTKTGGGTVTLSGANTYTGGTNVNAGTLALGASDRLADTGAVAVNSGTLDLGGFSDTVGAVTLSSGAISNGTLAGTSYSATNSGAVSAVLAGSGGFTKTGNGSVTFSAANTYTGDTIVSAGGLILSGSGLVASSLIQVQTGATLDGSAVSGGFQLQSGQTLENKGTFTGNLTALSGSTYAPGNSPGIATQVGNLTLNTGSIFEWELIDNTSDDAGINFDQTVFTSGGLTIQTGVTANLDFAYPGSTVDWTDSFWSSNQEWLVFTGASSLTNVAGIFTTLNVGLDSLGNTLAPSQGSFSFTSVGNDVYLNYTLGVIPEPSTTLLLAGALTALVIFRRRRRD